MPLVQVLNSQKSEAVLRRKRTLSLSLGGVLSRQPFVSEQLVSIFDKEPESDSFDIEVDTVVGAHAMRIVIRIVFNGDNAYSLTSLFVEG